MDDPVSLLFFCLGGPLLLLGVGFAIGRATRRNESPRQWSPPPVLDRGVESPA